MNAASATCGRCAAPLSSSGICPRCLLEAELPPARLGDALELEEELGRGGMGTVFRARHLRLGRTVAVKLLPPELSRDATARERFRREAHALAQLSHPNIVHVHDFDEAEGQPYIVMECVEGKPLSALLPLPLCQAVPIGLQVCDALAYAHARGVVHRDIKPANILVDANGQAKVTDFGIARLFTPGEAGWTLTAAEQVLGTPHYLAPEVLQGAAPDPQADVYALGVVLYQMLTGQLPVGAFAPLPVAIDPIVRRALAPDRTQRFASAAELRAALQRIPIDEPEALPPDEQMWLRGAALLCTASTAVAIWAGVLSLTPRVLRPDQMLPLVDLYNDRLPDGRFVSYARFEVGPTLVATLALAITFVALGLLRRHWRVSGLDSPRPTLRLVESRRVLALGVACVIAHAIRMVCEAHGWGSAPRIAPVLGGLAELLTLFLFFGGMLQAWRTARPLAKELGLFIGMALAVLPPLQVFVSYVSRWKP